MEGPVGEVDQDDQIKEQTTLGAGTVGAHMEGVDNISNDFAKTEKQYKDQDMVDPNDKAFDQFTEVNKGENELGFSKDDNPPEEEKGDDGELAITAR